MSQLLTLALPTTKRGRKQYSYLHHTYKESVAHMGLGQGHIARSSDPNVSFCMAPVLPNAVLRAHHFRSLGDLQKYRFPERAEGLVLTQKREFSCSSPSGSEAWLLSKQSLEWGGQAPPPPLILLQLSPAPRPSDTDGCSDLLIGTTTNPLLCKIHLLTHTHANDLYTSFCHTSNPNCSFTKLGIGYLTTDWTCTSSPWQLDSSLAHSTSLGPLPHTCPHTCTGSPPTQS